LCRQTAARIADAGDHRGVVELVREDHAAGQDLGERRQRRVVRDVARREQQRAFLAVQVGEFGLELDVVVRVATDVAGAAGARADVVQRLFHGLDHLGVLAHGEVVVRTPDGDRLRPVVPGEAARVGEGALVAQDVDEHAVPAFGVQTLDSLVEDLVVVHLNPVLHCPARIRGSGRRFSSSAWPLPAALIQDGSQNFHT
jgi:hypothetical protein